MPTSCLSCGAALMPGARFCPSCGAAAEAPTTAMTAGGTPAAGLGGAPAARPGPGLGQGQLVLKASLGMAGLLVAVATAAVFGFAELVVSYSDNPSGDGAKVALILLYLLATAAAAVGSYLASLQLRTGPSDERLLARLAVGFGVFGTTYGFLRLIAWVGL